jgi:hypothetical protein
MPGEAVRRPQQDEDTAIGFQGHITYQANDGPEQNPEDDMLGLFDPEQTPGHSGKREERSGKKPDLTNRK